VYYSFIEFFILYLIFDSISIIFVTSIAGGIVAGLLVPILVIGAIAGIWYYRKYYMQRHDDDRVTFTNAAYHVSNEAQIRIDDTHRKNGFYLKKPERHDEHHDHDDKH
jgi:hypothetical protein